MNLRVLVGVFLLVSGCYAYPTGAPEKACSTLAPEHPIIVDGQPTGEIHQPQTGVSPYTLSAEKNDDGSVTLTLSGDNFKGFVFRGFDENREAINGQFEKDDEMKTINCASEGDTITHVSRNDKSTLEFRWQPPSGYSGKVIFRGSVVKNYSTFWLQESAPIQL